MSGELTYTRLFEVADRQPDATALIFLGTRTSFGALKEAVLRFATALHRLGVGPGDRVLVYLPNSPQQVIASFAVQRLGAAVVPVSPIYTAHELAPMIRDAGAETAICLDTNFGYVQQVFAGGEAGLKRIVVTSLTELLPAWKRAAGHLLNRIPRGSVGRFDHVHGFGTLLRGAPPDPPDVTVDPDRDLAQLMFTGGTTAFPKAVPANHTSEVAYVRDVVDDVLAGHIRPGKDPLLMVPPLFHIMPRGFFIAVGLNCGNPTVLMPVPQPDAALAAIGRHGVRWMLGVPAMYRMLLECDRVDRYDLSSLRVCFSGGDALPVETSERWKARTGTTIQPVYGSTEVGHVTYGKLDVEPEAGSIGWPLKSYRTLVVAPETTDPVPDGEVGELLVASPPSLGRYANDEAATAAAFVEHEGSTWYRMGDFVIRRPDGSIRFVERTADVIKYKGYRVSASEIEAVLQDHPAVIAACVVGVPDEATGERIKAIVVFRHDARGVSGAALKAFARERLAPYKVPHAFEFRDMLPRSKVGKLLRREVRDEERRKAGGSS